MSSLFNISGVVNRESLRSDNDGWRYSTLIETFEKCSILFKVKEGENSNPPDFHRDSQEYPKVFRGLEFEPDTARPAIVFDDGGRLGKRGRFSKVSH